MWALRVERAVYAVNAPVPLGISVILRPGVWVSEVCEVHGDDPAAIPFPCQSAWA